MKLLLTLLLFFFLGSLLTFGKSIHDFSTNDIISISNANHEDKTKMLTNITLEVLNSSPDKATLFYKRLLDNLDMNFFREALNFYIQQQEYEALAFLEQNKTKTDIFETILYLLIPGYITNDVQVRQYFEALKEGDKVNQYIYFEALPAWIEMVNEQYFFDTYYLFVFNKVGTWSRKEKELRLTKSLESFKAEATFQDENLIVLMVLSKDDRFLSDLSEDRKNHLKIFINSHIIDFAQGQMLKIYGRSFFDTVLTIYGAITPEKETQKNLHEKLSICKKKELTSAEYRLNIFYKNWITKIISFMPSDVTKNIHKGFYEFFTNLLEDGFAFT